jgi:glycosyltransferase involved in cell wall biosynthesis
MPVYNCELYIKEAVDSILNQTFTDFEFLIIDDASSDETVTILKSYYDPRIKLIEKPLNTGYTNSLNQGLKLAKGEYIARMDGDDISLPERFAKQVAFLNENPEIIMCGTSYSIIGENEVFLLPENHQEIKINLLKGNCIVHPSVMLRNNIIVANNIIYDQQMEPAEDYDLWVRLLLIGELHNLQECLLSYRVHDSQVSTIRDKKQVHIAKDVRLKLLFSLENSISQKQKNIYLKYLKDEEELTFDEFTGLIDLKIKLVNANVNSFFSNVGFNNYWIQIESNFINYYFKNRTSYSIVILKQYLSIFSKLNRRLKANEMIKLFVKSLLNHRVK